MIPVIVDSDHDRKTCHSRYDVQVRVHLQVATTPRDPKRDHDRFTRFEIHEQYYGFSKVV